MLSGNQAFVEVTCYCSFLIRPRGCTINENADPDVQHDILLTLNELIPRNNPGYRHAEGNSDAHVKASMIGFSETIMIEGGKLVLGTWQGVYFMDFDGPRQRKLHIRVIPGD